MFSLRFSRAKKLQLTSVTCCHRAASMQFNSSSRRPLFSIDAPREPCLRQQKKSFKMKLSTAVIAAALSQSALAFSPAASARKSMALNGFDLSGNSWKPDSEKMGSTDTGDYFPEGYDPNEIAFTEGWQGSQELLVDKDRGGPQL